MPLYEYQCKACGKRFEQIQKFSDPHTEICAECGKGPVRRLLSSPAIQFKGTGWYITDYDRKGQKDPNAAAAKNEKGEKSEKGEQGTKETKGEKGEKKGDQPAKETKAEKSGTAASSSAEKKSSSSDSSGGSASPAPSKPTS
jgi:putative FmdB family regulatory protein